MLAPIGKDIAKAVSYIAQGRVVAFPTGTSYGLAVNALKGHALQRLRNLKQRPIEKTFTVFLPESLVNDYVALTSAEKDFLQTHSNKPITLLVTPKEPLMHLEKDGLIGLRVIDNKMMKDFAEQCGVPLTATSANISDNPPTYGAQDVQRSFPLNKDETTYDMSLAYILDGGRLQEGAQSTILKLSDSGNITVIREGTFAV